VKLPLVPGPSDVIAAVEGLRDGVSDALALVPRITTAVGRVEEVLDGASSLLQRARGLVDRMESTLDSADAAVRSVGETRARADEAIRGVSDTQSKADDAITAIGLTTTRADDTLALAEALVGRFSPLMGDYEQPLRDLVPSVRRLSETFDPHEVEALVTLIDRMPTLVTHLDEDILPVLESLRDVGTDVHDLVDTVQDLRQIVKGFPGSRLFRRRGADEIAQEEREQPGQGI
jgi:archaellum component FlaC